MQLRQLAAIGKVTQIAVVKKRDAHQAKPVCRVRRANFTHGQCSSATGDAHKIGPIFCARRAGYQRRGEQIAQPRTDCLWADRLTVAPGGNRLLPAVQQQNQLMGKHLIKPAADVLIQPRPVGVTQRQVAGERRPARQAAQLAQMLAEALVE